GACPKVRQSAPCGKGGRAATPAQLQRMTRREQQAHHISRIYVACVPKWGCVPRQKGPGIDLPAKVLKVASLAVAAFEAEGARQRKENWNAIKDIASAAGADQEKTLLGCAKDASEGMQETAAMWQTPYIPAKVAAVGWAVTKCAAGVVGG